MISLDIFGFSPVPLDVKRLCEPGSSPSILTTLAADFIQLTILPSAAFTVDLPKFAETEVFRSSIGVIFLPAGSTFLDAV